MRSSAEDHRSIMDCDSKSSRMHLEGKEGTELVAHKGAPIDDEAQRAESSQNAMGPSFI